MNIEDGTGTGRKVRVNLNNEMITRAVSSSEQAEATENAVAYNINTGLITLTSASESALLYLKNNENRDLHVTSIIVILGPTANGVATDTTRLRVYRNPTAGTIVSDATDVDDNSNRNFGSSKTLTADAYKGDEAKTITDGGVHIESLITPGNRVFFSVDEFLTKGDSIGVSLEPNDSNTSMKVMIAIACHLNDPDA